MIQPLKALNPTKTIDCQKILKINMEYKIILNQRLKIRTKETDKLRTRSIYNTLHEVFCALGPNPQGVPERYLEVTCNSP